MSGPETHREPFAGTDYRTGRDNPGGAMTPTYTPDGHRSPPPPPAQRQARRASIAVTSILAALMLAIAVGAFVKHQQEAADMERWHDQIRENRFEYCLEYGC